LTRPVIDEAMYGKRTIGTEIGMFQGGFHWRAGFAALKEIAQSLFFPNAIYIILLNSTFIGVSLAASQTMTPVLLAAPYS
jgi:hypothetical protein